LYALADLRTPIVATVIGEGGSGGALALALADVVMMLEHSVYSVASPEGAAAILWGDASKAEAAASRLRRTSADLTRFGIVDRVLPRPPGGAHRAGRNSAGSAGQAMMVDSTPTGVAPPSTIKSMRPARSADQGSTAPPCE